MSLILSVCPSFEKKLKDHRDYWGDDNLLYLELGEFSRHLIEKLNKKDTSEFEEIFTVVEMLHTEGDSYVKEAATIGLLEGIQNNSEHLEVNPSKFEKYLKIETKKC